MPDRDLLEEYPFYRTKKIELERKLYQLESPAIAESLRKLLTSFCGDIEELIPAEEKPR
jgi:hypothetical protein